jgi:hypothetical protein
MGDAATEPLRCRIDLRESRFWTAVPLARFADFSSEDLYSSQCFTFFAAPDRNIDEQVFF